MLSFLSSALDSAASSRDFWSLTEAVAPRLRKPRFVAISSAVRPCWLTDVASARALTALKTKNQSFALEEKEKR